MQLLMFVISMFVCRIQLRRIQNFKSLDVRLTKIGTASCFLLPMLPFLKIQSLLCFTILIFHHIFVSSLNTIYEWMKLRKAHGMCLSALTKIILYMQIGNSLRSALEHLTISERDPFWRKQWAHIAENVAFSPQESGFKCSIVRRLARDLILCDQLSFQQVGHLSEIRSIYKKESDFRRRSGQSLAQLRIQAIILCGLHLAVTAFMIHQFSWSSHKLVFVMSFLLMGLGLIVLLRMGRNTKWKT